MKEEARRQTSLTLFSQTTSPSREGAVSASLKTDVHVISHRLQCLVQR